MSTGRRGAITKTRGDEALSAFSTWIACTLITSVLTAAMLAALNFQFRSGTNQTVIMAYFAVSCLLILPAVSITAGHRAYKKIFGALDAYSIRWSHFIALLLAVLSQLGLVLLLGLFLYVVASDISSSEGDGDWAMRNTMTTLG